MNIGIPNPFDTLQESFRATAEYFTLQMSWGKIRDSVPGGNGEPILVLPGFGMDDWTTGAMRGFLREKGYYVHGWRGGTNWGYNGNTAAHLNQRLDALAQQHGSKISIVGHSLGGFLGREMAKAHPGQVERVITLGSPFGAFERGSVPPPVPTSSIYSRSDGVVSASTCLNPKMPRAENIEISSSHLGLIANPLSLLVVADRMAQDPAHWKAFDRRKYLSMLFTQSHDDYAPAPNAAERGLPALAF